MASVPHLLRRDPDSRSGPRAPAGRVLTLAATLALLATLTPGLPARLVAADAAWPWFKADLHVHSVLSADAYPDLGIISHNAQSAGYNAIFLTDHNLGSSFPINSLTANHFVFEDTYTRWYTRTAGSLSSSTDALASSPVHSGTQSLRLSASSSTTGEAFVWQKRGPNFRSGDAMLKVSLYPTTLSAGSGLYVSASIGGDPTIASPVGYTTSAGTVSPGLSKVFVWYFGAAPAASLFPGSTLVATNLASTTDCDRAFALNAWITCTIDLNSALPRLPAAALPLDYDAWQDLKMSAVASGGTAAGYFDTYSVDASAPVPPGNEFVYRDGFLGQATPGPWDVPGSFRIFPSLEMGTSEHANRFDFDITDPSMFVSYKNGIDGILPTQQTGYPAQLNHPGVPGGVTDAQAVSTNAEGADLMEVRYPNMIADWDQILGKGVPLVGTWGADNHLGKWSGSSLATYISAPSLNFDALIRSLYEGRAYLATNSFSPGRVVFNLDGRSSAPYPARYPVYVSSSAASFPVHLGIAGGIASGSKMIWVANGTTVATDTPGASYDATKSIAISAATNYVRAELRNSSGTQTAMSQAILLDRVAGLPVDMSYHVDGVTTASGHDYTRLVTKGITASTWDATNQALDLTLTNPASALVELEAATAGSVPSSVSVGGSRVLPSASLADFQGATGTTWFYDASARVLHVKATQGSGPTPVVLAFGSGTPDTTPPSVPTGLTAAAVGSTEIDLAWSPSVDPDSAVAGYEVYRGGSLLATVGGSTLGYHDSSVNPGTAYSYTVDAFDPAGNHSAQSAAVGATTPAGAVTVNLVADAYVSSGAPTTNYGGSTALRVDASPIVESYLKFTLSGLSGTVTKATLRFWANSSQGVGYDVLGVADTTWGEKTITYGTAPTLAATKTGSSGPVSSGTWTSVDVTQLITGNGTFSVALTTTDGTALSLASRESTNPPQLVIQTGP